MRVPSPIVHTEILFQTYLVMSSESMQNQPPSQTSGFAVSQPVSQPSLDQQRWNPQTIGQLTDPEEQNRYHHFYREWVARTYGVEVVSLPPQQFFQDPTYPPYLRNIGITILGMYINLKKIIKF